jgi:hypothetical protein
VASQWRHLVQHGMRGMRPGGRRRRHVVTITR